MGSMAMKLEEFSVFLKCFLPAFCLFFVLGAVAGWGDRKEIAAVKLYGLTKAKLNKQEQCYYLVAKCDDEKVIRYSVDNNTCHIDYENSSLENGIRALEASSIGKPSKRHMKYINMMSSFIGGPTAGITYAKFFKASSGKRKFWTVSNLRKHIYAIIGAITGYTVGNHLGKNYDTNFDSELISEIIKDKEMWRNFEKKRLCATLKEIQAREGAKFRSITALNVYPHKDDPIVKCVPTFNDNVNRYIKMILQPEFDPTSKNFTFVCNLKEKHERLQNSAEYNELVRLISYGATTKRLTDHPALQERLGYSKERWDGLCRLLKESIGELKFCFESSASIKNP